MANTEQKPALLSESHGNVVVESDAANVQRHMTPTSLTGEPNSRPDTPPQPPRQAQAQDSSSPPSSSADSRPAAAPTRPTLVQLGTAVTQASTHHPPKKFNAVNINKKFLEKNSAVAAMATSSSTSATSKSGGSISRPQIQTTQSHSRLVTTKLTGSPAPSTTTGPGWSRPTSTAPSSTGTDSPIGSSPLPSAAVALSVNSAAPQLPHVGKVIQPQPRAVMVQTTNLQKEGAKHLAKPAWGNVKTPPGPLVMTPQDFPTAAEVAQATALRKPKQDDQKSESTSAVKHRLEEEADTFRGVHLDPNAHHWGEMEEDNDDFLEGVIEFGDGRQYKIEATEPSSSPPPDDHSLPVSKEDRFIDDFDRSWPKSKPSPTSSTREFTTASPALSSRGNSLQGGQDHSHPQLFNERSNRLEPYGHGPRAGQTTYQNRRGSHNESTSPIDSRRGNVQLLQKSGNGDLLPRSRGMNGASSRGGFSVPTGDRRDSGARRDHPSSPRMARNEWGHHDMAPSTSLQGRDREPSERGRRSDMGPPPVPLHATRRPSQDSARQLPPHLSPNMSIPRRLSSHERDFDGRFGALPTSPQSSRFAPPSPAMSHASTLALSPGAASVALPGGATADLDEVTRDLMQTAAARAKARKQQDEAEREAQKERARRKAAELEEKMKAQEAEKLKNEQGDRTSKEEVEQSKAKVQEKEVVAFIESAIDGSKSQLQERRPSVDSASLPKNLPRRPPSQRGQQRRMSTEAGSGPGPGARRPSFGLGTRAPLVPDTSPASQAETWRTKMNPLPPPPPTPRDVQTRTAPSASEPLQPTPAAAPSTALDHVANIAEGPMNDLEVVDFSNMGNFVDGEQKEEGAEETVAEPEKTEPETSQEVISSKARPTASSFFEDDKGTMPLAKADNVWRRKTSASTVIEPEEKARAVVVREESTLRVSSSAPVMMTTPSHPQPRLRPHTEASMSALDDAMSRIKGAMQASGAGSKENRPPASSPETEHHHPLPPTRTPYPQPSSTAAKNSLHRERWQPASTITPSLPKQLTRSQAEEKLEQLREPLSTSFDPFCTPPSADLTVQLPKISHRIEPVSRRQQHLFSKLPPPPRLDLLSFEPPVQGMNKRDFSVNSVLFRPGIGFKANRIRVLIPGSKSGHSGGARTVSIGPKYNIGTGVFGKPTNADGATSWRKFGAVPGKVDEKDKEQKTGGVDTAESGDKGGARDQDVKVPEEKQQEEQHPSPPRTRQQHKMPAGSVVAFIRDSRIDVVEADPKPLVNFIVTSELDEPAAGVFSSVTSSSEADKDVEGAGSNKTCGPLTDGLKTGGTELNSVQAPSPSSSKLKAPENKTAADESTTTHSISAPSPTHQATTPWGRVPIKDGNVRAPDPEHLKAVWSQPANKADLNPVNSLEGIADDLTSVPFSIQDVKSEDGETPPPALPSTTSRMSLHEVTKAFQKVPSSSSSNSSSQSRNPLTPPSNNNTPASRSPYPYSPMPPNAMRLPHSYDHYSPMLSHSPSPTVIYPHQMTSSPVPSRLSVNGHAPMYQAPVWIPHQPTPAPGNHAAVMRPIMSPYPAHMMPYGSPNGPVYAHPMSTMPGPPQQPPPVGNGRGRGVMMSPAMSHAHAHAAASMYASSPVMVHMQPLPPHQNPAYIGVPPPPSGTPGRGQPRTDMSQAHPSQATNATGQQQPHHPSTYNPAASFIRSTW